MSVRSRLIMEQISKIKCSVVLFLAIQSTTTIILVNGNDKCDSLSDLKYELFATKTTYSDAREYLRKIDDDDLPKSFDDDKLEKEHNELRKDGCKPLVFYFIGRHSARFPDAEDIEKYNKDLAELIVKLRSTSPKCQRKRSDFLRWKSKMQSKHDNLITDLGGREERDIARRFKRLYPEFFNTSQADIQIGVTGKIRTAQTGAEFLREVEGLNLAACDERTTPTNDVDRKDYDLNKVVEAACYKYLTGKFEKPFLEFHKQCEKISGEAKIKDPRIDRVKNPNLKKRIADRVARKLGLDNGGSDPPVTSQVLDSIYNTCRFENALDNDSIWCDLFDKRDIEALEYIEDVSSYIKSAYGPSANPKQSCPLVKDLLDALNEGVEMKDPKNQRKKSYFYFSHADPMKKLLATFDMFRDDDNFSDSRISEFERELKVPKKRSWRTSVITPFSANMVFVLYRCQESPDEVAKFKILAAVTEQPVKLGGCKDTDCNSQRFFNTYNNMHDCDLNRVCQRH